MLAGEIGARRNLRRMPCSRQVTSCMLSPQNVPITVSDNTGPIRKVTACGLPFAKTLPYKKKNTMGMIRLKNRKALFRVVMRMRIAASVSIVFNPAASFRSAR